LAKALSRIEPPDYHDRNHSIPRRHRAAHPAIGPVAALVAGILILMKPDLLAKIVAVYLIVVGALGLLG
jgi:hypothetical protein